MSEGEPDVPPATAKVSSMKPGRISAAVEGVLRETVAEAVSPLGNTLISCKQFSPDIHYVLFQQNLFTGVPLLGASTSRGPADLPEGIRGEAVLQPQRTLPSWMSCIPTCHLISLSLPVELKRLRRWWLQNQSRSHCIGR